MKVGIFNFNEPIDSCVENGLFHAHAHDEFIGMHTSPIGKTVIGINPKRRIMDAIAAVVSIDTDWSFETGDTTVLKLEVIRLNHPIPLELTVLEELADQIERNTAEVFLASKKLGAILQQLLKDSGQPTVWEAKAITSNQRLAEVRTILTRDDLTDSSKVELILAKDGIGRFGDAVWTRNLKTPFDKEGVMGKELRVVHIRPWEDSTDSQRLDADNGLLLPSKIADAFTSGYITFDLEGRIVVSSYMMRNVWNLEGSTSEFCAPLEMNRGRHIYMHYHREHIYERWLRAA